MRVVEVTFKADEDTRTISVVARTDEGASRTLPMDTDEDQIVFIDLFELVLKRFAEAVDADNERTRKRDEKRAARRSVPPERRAELLAARRAAREARNSNSSKVTP